ncbi:MAG TPA: SymE family type I addiction module toxin [Bacteroidia bacterium]|nr:SymE family type I addiction module toxin [Bacteroidia bacterium]
MEKIRKRKQKVYYQHYGKYGQTHPFIRIAGQYLKKFGFNTGDTIEIKIETNCIVISKIQQ